ncbi:MAG: glutathione S-transferase N-terminal domain-containing protein [Chloroflexota bacterium]
MVDLYTWRTLNGFKPLILVEELGIDYTLKPIRIDGQQKSEAFLQINPNGRIPALVDHLANGEPVTVFESGAMLIYLAEKAGQFLPPVDQPQARASVMSWLMFQMGGVGPIFGQLGYARRLEEPPQVRQRFEKEVMRLHMVMNTQLGKTEYLAGDYSIADMAIFPWTSRPGYVNMPLDDFPNIKRWEDAIVARPAVQRALATQFE